METSAFTGFAALTNQWANGWANMNLTYVILLITLPLLLIGAYMIRVFLKGRAHFDRVERQGSSHFLGKDLMEMGYWAMQPFAKLLVFFQVTPNQISMTSILFGLLSGACLVFGHFGFAAGLLAISGLMDALDGLVARLRGLSSEAGEVLDSALDRYVEFFFLAGLAIHYREILPLLLLTLFAILGSFMVSYSSLYARSKQVQIPPMRWRMKRPERLVYLTLGAALSPVTIPWFEQVRVFPVAIGHPMAIAVGLVAVFANVFAIEQLAHTMKTVRERAAAEKEKKELALKEAAEEEIVAQHLPQGPSRR